MKFNLKIQQHMIFNPGKGDKCMPPRCLSEFTLPTNQQQRKKYSNDVRKN